MRTLIHPHVKFWIVLLLGLNLTLSLKAQDNAIVIENKKPGNPSSEWDVTLNGDPSIQGSPSRHFASDRADASCLRYVFSHYYNH